MAAIPYSPLPKTTDYVSADYVSTAPTSAYLFSSGVWTPILIAPGTTTEWGPTYYVTSEAHLESVRCAIEAFFKEFPLDSVRLLLQKTREGLIDGRIWFSLGSDRSVRTACIIGWLVVGAGREVHNWVDAHMRSVMRQSSVDLATAFGKFEPWVANIHPGHTPSNSSYSARLERWCSDYIERAEARERTLATMAATPIATLVAEMTDAAPAAPDTYTETDSSEITPAEVPAEPDWAGGDDDDDDDEGEEESNGTEEDEEEEEEESDADAGDAPDVLVPATQLSPTVIAELEAILAHTDELVLA